jgi:hypothetical protein
MIGLLLAVTLAATQAAAQDPTPATIDSGMTRAQVVAKLGEPMSARTYDGHTYLLYKNGCERSCGMSDLVVLDSDKVVDAIFRSNARRYSGTSSSPRMISIADARVGSDKAENVGNVERVAAPANVEASAMPTKAAKVAVPAKTEKAATLASADKHPAPAKVANVAVPKVQTIERVEKVKAEPVKVEKVENGDAVSTKPSASKVPPSAAPKSAPQAAPQAAPQPAAPKLPQVFRPAPTPKKDTTKKSDQVKKPTS